MIFLVLAIVGSGLIPVLFRAFDSWRVNVFWAIPVNYLTCALVGRLWAGQALDLARLPSQPWVGLALLQGVILAINFYLLAYTAQRAGVAVAALASRLSVAIPAILAFFIYNDSLNLLKFVGLGAALFSLYLCTAPDGRSNADRSLSIKLLPLLLFFTFGCYFTIIKYAQAHFLNESTYHPYDGRVSFAFLTSAHWRSAKAARRPPFSFQPRAGGVLLGAVNYIAVYALIKCSAPAGWQSCSSIRFIASEWSVSTLLAMILFRERLSRMRAVGLFVGLISVALLNQ
jgi:drug/metabolite transporter (DMT)-like permease